MFNYVIVFDLETVKNCIDKNFMSFDPPVLQGKTKDFFYTSVPSLHSSSLQLPSSMKQ